MISILLQRSKAAQYAGAGGATSTKPPFAGGSAPLDFSLDDHDDLENIDSEDDEFPNPAAQIRLATASTGFTSASQSVSGGVVLPSNNLNKATDAELARAKAAMDIGNDVASL